MVQLTIEVPDDLAARLRPIQNRLVDVIELGLREISAGEYALHSELAEFLAGGPTPQEILEFRPSAEVMEHVAELLSRNREGQLTSTEQAELDRYETLDYLMTLVKVRARHYLVSS